MKSVAFTTLKEGDTFTYKNTEYVKTATVKISCCKFTNAYQLADNKRKIGLKPQDLVEIAE